MQGKDAIAELTKIVALWKRAKAKGEAVYLATVVHVSGSAYRKTGARLLVTASGEYAGSVSGGCLEAEIARRIAWLTRSGPCVEQYRSTLEEGEEPSYGLGCGGTIWILMEAGPGAERVLAALQRALEQRVSSVAVFSFSETRCATTLASFTEDGTVLFDAEDGLALSPEKAEIAWEALAQGKPLGAPGDPARLPSLVCSPVLPLPRLTVFGAGDDAKPLVKFAAELDWEITVADGRSHLLRRERFPEASKFCLLQYNMQRGDHAQENEHPVLAHSLALGSDEFAVILTHSLNQDRALLQELLPLSLPYLGVLGPLHRTQRLLDEISPVLGIGSRECFKKLHAPVGLDFGAGDAAVIALSIVAEMQMVLGRTSGVVERRRTSVAAGA